MSITFTVPAVPVPQPRQRVAVIGGRARNYTPKTHSVQAFKKAVKIAARMAYRGELLDGPLRLHLQFVLPRPKRLKRGDMAWHHVRPDIDNLSKSVQDALTGVVWTDDCQVCENLSQKFYAKYGQQPYVFVKIEAAHQ